MMIKDRVTAKRTTGTGADLTVLYDADCGFCMASVRWLQRRDRHGRLTFLALQDAETSTEPWFREVAAGHDLRSALHVIDGMGRVTEGGTAMVGVLRRLPRWGVLGWLGGLPPARPLVESAYRLISGHRLGLGRLVRAEGPACRMPPAGGSPAA
jgi:acetyl esterase